MASFLVVGLSAQNSWLLGFASPSFHLTKGNTVPVDGTFDGQSQARLFATANSDIMATAILPLNVARTFHKSSPMVVTTGKTSALQFNLTSTAPLLATITNCVNTVKAGGISSVGEFSAPKAVSEKATRRTRNRARLSATPAPVLSSVPTATSSPIIM